MGEGEMIRGVPGIWYCCDMLTSAQLEARDGETEPLAVPLVFPPGRTTEKPRMKLMALAGTRWDFAWVPGI